MKRLSVCTAICVIGLGAIILSAEDRPSTQRATSRPSNSLAVWDTEIPEMLMNSEDGMKGLKLHIRVSPGVTKGKECRVTVEIENTSAYVQAVYMPGLTMFADFTPDTVGTRMLEPPPSNFGRLRAKDERLNYVVLMGGDIYGRTYNWLPWEVGSVTFKAVYQSTKDGTEIGVKASQGKLSGQSEPVRVEAAEVDAPKSSK